MSNDKLAALLRECLADYSHPHFTDRGGMADRIRAALQAHAAEATQPQPAVPVAWMHPELHKRHPYADECLSAEAIDGWVPLYTHPQPSQDASKYQELLMAVEKKFPGESRHETALRYIRQAELRSCEPKCDAAMAKESGR